MPGLVALAGELPDSDPCHLNYHLIYFITIFFHTCRVRWENAGLCLLQKLGPMGMGVEVWVGYRALHRARWQHSTGSGSNCRWAEGTGYAHWGGEGEGAGGS